MKVQKAAVVGAGTMGAGIACVLSQTGMEVILKDVSQEFVERGLSNIKRMYDSRVKKEILTQTEADYLFANIKGSTTYEDFKDVDLVIEAALETMDLKRQIFADLDKICPPHAILATNTSALSISEIASCTKRPSQVLGMHFFNPAQTMKLVEVIPGVHTSPLITEKMLQLCRDLNKIPVRVEECPGFLVNRLLFPYLNEALYVLTEGSATVEDIDKKAVEFGLPMGPFTLLDMTGIDVCLHVTDYLYSEYGPRFEPAPLLKLMVERGYLGQKKEAGFYLHPKGQQLKKDEPKPINPELKSLIEESRKLKSPAKASASFDVHRIILPMFNEALYALQEKVVAVHDVDVAMQWGCGMSKGLLSLAEAKGLDWCLSELRTYEKLHGERFRPAWLATKFVRADLRDFKELKAEPVAAR